MHEPFYDILDRPYVSGKSLVKAGEDVVLKCKYAGSEAFAWYKGNEKLVGKDKATGQLMNIYKTRYLNLTLPNVTSNSIGKYGCSVVIGNTTLTTTIHLNVLGKSKLKKSYPRQGPKFFLR